MHTVQNVGIWSFVIAKAGAFNKRFGAKFVAIPARWDCQSIMKVLKSVSRIVELYEEVGLQTQRCEGVLRV